MLIFFLLALVAFVSLSLTICTFQYFQPITSKNYFLLLKLFDTFKSFWSNDCCLVHKKPLLSVFLRSKSYFWCLTHSDVDMFYELFFTKPSNLLSVICYLPVFCYLANMKLDL